MLTYSVRPRGGVVHALSVAEALASRGHRVRVVAMARPGQSMFRPAAVPVHLIPHEPAEESYDDRIAGMLAAYRAGLRPEAEGGWDVVHAQDCLSANAALALRDEGLLPHVVRTVHHVDDFTSPSLVECQERSILGPDLVLGVSEPWVRRLADDFGVEAGLVPNGVDTVRFRPSRDAAERDAARRRFGLDGRFAVVTVGGVEPRKGSLTLLEGFARLRERRPGLRPLLVIAGGATLFDYRDEARRFEERLGELGCADDVVRTGPLPDGDVPALLRAADVFAFPSVKEGFGLAALEALASAIPVVATDLDVFRGFLMHGETALLVSVGDSAALGDAFIRLADDPAAAAAIGARGPRVAAAWDWGVSAAAHERAYAAFLRRASTVGV